MLSARGHQKCVWPEHAVPPEKFLELCHQRPLARNNNPQRAGKKRRLRRRRVVTPELQVQSSEAGIKFRP